MSWNRQALDAILSVGVWIDRNDFIRQELTADGRYDETWCRRPTPAKAAIGSTAGPSP
ncbi:Atu4866 domain-containing protein [Streptomyces sp. NPDC001185]|uniref:Atu4866 domain-containing protein n=1 Tax=Streptomyces sp. NPDC001185 TaxID=3154380 RepID=UPI00332C5D31